MIVRTEKDQNDEQKKLRSVSLYKERRKERLQEAGLSKLQVSFDTLHIREYPIILGANPAVSQGPPLEIDWKHQDEETWKIDLYEKTRPDRRTYLEMNIPMELRIQILSKTGESIKNMNIRAKEMKAIRIKRLETSQSLYRSKTHERVEMVGRALRNFFTDRKKKEKTLLAKTKSLGDIVEDENSDGEYVDEKDQA